MLTINRYPVEPGSAAVYPTILNTYDVRMRLLKWDGDEDAWAKTDEWIHFGETTLTREHAAKVAELANQLDSFAGEDDEDDEEDFDDGDEPPVPINIPELIRKAAPMPQTFADLQPAGKVAP